ncbi:hemerythrin domain-containing protein [Shewanella intestini]|uniref:Hemerythrin n=1 Tax=Shewanella intestini TaxID=2017544 RepID=A0ABS5HY91_9GAMM|nr:MULTISPECIES: hemerythrin domain-containing protein [Shewanella]MBR9726676.1 hemerythrin [Shewanella intestini]MRG34758.1 hemerythrin [Shewanella sp. XMDDZSB0408]
MLERLLRDHKHIAILLDILAKKQTKLADGEAINFSLVRDIVEYMQSYAEYSHHPLEDITFDFYLKKMGKGYHSQLHDEHTRLAESSGALMYSLNMILSDVVIANDKLITDFKDYIELQRCHMEYEEREVFPLFETVLTSADWDSITSQSQQRLVDDPLFSGNALTSFEELKQYIQVSE